MEIPRVGHRTGIGHSVTASLLSAPSGMFLGKERATRKATSPARSYGPTDHQRLFLTPASWGHPSRTPLGDSQMVLALSSNPRLHLVSQANEKLLGSLILLSSFTDPQRCYCHIWLALFQEFLVIKDNGGVWKPDRPLFFLRMCGQTTCVC